MSAVFLKVVILLALVPLNALLLTYMERKVLGHIQIRYGPMYTGFHGILQAVADALKLLIKEDVVPTGADRFLFWAAPIMVFVPSFVLYVSIPAAPGIVIKEVDLALFFVFAVAALFPLGFTLAGWAAHNKYTLLGGLRAAAQQISYEVPMLLSFMGVVMLTGTMKLSGIVAAQKSIWFIFLQPIGFIVFFITILAELNRTPFDMPEAESELVTGYNTEYSGMKFALLFLAEYSNMFVVSALTVLLFLGGWRGPWLPPIVWMLIKTYAVVFVILWLRATLPRIRVDQLMELGWKVLMPVALLNLMLTGLLITGLGL